ncbi:YraN family protein [Paenibacillus wynnii]|uniref:YraN family protein n=1 Tax=Paenibacillus wynnii TaxID=268407 RepID=UPI00278CD1A7|nr:YraN family protein [Paenibacillus wynnii]MDQ0192746.1 putative endonuclease [Paenibacillus wynnii]
MNNLTPGAKYNRKQKGNAAEEAAAQYLSSLGYEIIERNWRCRSGEIDIIAWERGRLIFVEVRSRSNRTLQGSPEESVNVRKIQQVRSVAEFYLYIKRQPEGPLSFDVISVILNSDLSVASLNHIREAF